MKSPLFMQLVLAFALMISISPVLVGADLQQVEPASQAILGTRAFGTVSEYAFELDTSTYSATIDRDSNLLFVEGIKSDSSIKQIGFIPLQEPSGLTTAVAVVDIDEFTSARVTLAIGEAQTQPTLVKCDKVMRGTRLCSKWVSSPEDVSTGDGVARFTVNESGMYALGTPSRPGKPVARSDFEQHLTARLPADSLIVTDLQGKDKLQSRVRATVTDVWKNVDSGKSFVRAELGVNSIELSDVENINKISKIDILPLGDGLNTDRLNVEGAQNASGTVRLAKHGSVTSIVRCDDTSYDGNCSGWVKTGIPFTDYGSYIEFTAPHFSVYGGLGDVVVLKAVYTGSATMAASTNDTNITLSQSINTSSSFLVFGTNTSSNEPQCFLVAGQITNSTTLRFRREGGVCANAATITWQVAEFRNGVNVQRGTTAMGTSTSLTQTLTAINPNKTFPIISNRNGGTTFGNDDLLRATIQNSTTLNLSLATASLNNHVSEWQVIEMQGTTVQNGTVATGTTDSEVNITTATINTTRAWLIYSTQGETGTTTNIAQKLFNGKVVNSTQIRYNRGSTGTANSISWYLVELPNGTNVQHGVANLSTTTLTENITITIYNHITSIVAGGLFQRGGETTYTGDDNPGTAWAAFNLTNNTGLTITRGATGTATANISYFVIDFAEGIVPWITSVTLNTTDNPTNSTNANLTAYPIGAIDHTTLIYDWRVNGTSITLLNMPFDMNYTGNNTLGLEDYSTYQNNGTLGNGSSGSVPTWSSSGKVGGAYVFDGSNDIISTSATTSLNSTFIGGGTVTAWIYPTGWGGNAFGRIIDSKGTATRWLWYLDQSNGNAESMRFVYEFSGGGGTWNSPGSSITLNQWKHAAIVYDASSASNTPAIYIDGIAVTASNYGIASGTPNQYATETLSIGNREALDRAFDGRIDDVRVYNRSLSAGQIYQIFLEGNNSINASTFVASETTAGDAWSVLVTPNNASIGDGTAQTSNSVTIQTTNVACGVLTTNTTMTNNLSSGSGHCFNITAANVVLNCNGYSITGDSTSSVNGINVLADNVAVKGCTVQNMGSSAVYVNRSNGFRLENSSTHGQHSVYIERSNNTLIRNSTLLNRLVGSDDGMIILSNSNNLTVENVTMTPAFQAKMIDGGSSSNVVFRNVTMTQVSMYYYNFPTNITFINSTLGGYPALVYELGTPHSTSVCPAFIGNLTFGMLYVYACNNLQIQNFTIDGSGGHQVGLMLDSVENVLVRNMTNNIYPAITLGYSSNVTIADGRPSRISIEGGSNISVRNASIIYDLGLASTLDISITNTSFIGGATIYRGWDSVTGLTVENSSFVLDTDPFSGSNSMSGSIVFRNTTLNTSRIANYSGNGIITVQYFIDAQVNSTSGAPSASASVTVKNASGTTWGTGTTSATGRVSALNVTVFQRNGTVSWSSYNYTVNASKSGVSASNSYIVNSSIVANLTIADGAPYIVSISTLPTAPTYNGSTAEPVVIQANASDGDGNLISVNFTVIRPDGTYALTQSNGSGLAAGGIWNSSSISLNQYGQWNITVNATDANGSVYGANATIRFLQVTAALNESSGSTGRNLTFSGRVLNPEGAAVASTAVTIKQNGTIITSNMLAGWTYRRSYTVNASQFNGTHTNFTLLVRLDNETNLSAYAQNDGDDIVFTNVSNGRLSHDIEFYNTSNGKLVAWVRIPELANTSNYSFYMYFGNSSVSAQSNSSDVWPGYYGMWGLGDNLSTTLVRDGTLTNNGTAQGGMNSASRVDGVSGNGLSFVRASTQEVTTTTQFTNPDGFTMGSWVRTTSSTGDWFLGFGNMQVAAPSSYDRTLYVDTNGKARFGCFDGTEDTAISTTTVNDGNWHHVQGVHNSSNDTLMIFIDGVYEGAATTLNCEIYNGWWRMGGRGSSGWPNSGGSTFNGDLDSVAIFNGTRTAARVAAEYANQRPNSTFVSAGSTTSGVTTNATGYYSTVVEVLNSSRFTAEVESGGLTGVGVATYSLTTGTTSLNATDNPINSTNANLTLWLANLVANESYIADWQINNISIARSLFSFDTNTSSTIAGAIFGHTSSNSNGTIPSAGSTPTWTSAGKLGGAYVFDGVNDYMDIVNQSVPDTFTYAAWIKPNNASAGNIIEHRIDAADRAMYLSNGVLYTGMWPDTPGTVGGGHVGVGVWTHVALTFDGSTIRGYVNGTLVASAADIANPAGPVNWFSIGRADDGSGWVGGLDSHFNGSIDDVRIYDRALSTAQIAFIAAETNQSNRYISANDTSGGDVWRARVFGNDGTGIKSNVTTNTVRITSVCVNETGVCWNTIQQAIDNATTGQAVVITDGGTYSESIIVNKTIRITSNGSAYPVITAAGSVVNGTGYVLNLSRVHVVSTGTTGTAVFANQFNLVDASINLTTAPSDMGAVSASSNPSYNSIKRVNISAANASHSIGTIDGTNNFDLLQIRGNWTLSSSSTNIYLGYGPTILSNTTINVSQNSGIAGQLLVPGSYSNLTNVTIYFNSLGGGDQLIRNDNRPQVTVSNSFWNTTSDIMQFGNDITFVNTTLETDYVALRHADAGVLISFTVIDSIIRAPTPISIQQNYAGATGKIRFINSTVSTTGSYINGFTVDGAVNITYENYVTVNASTTSGAAISGASVTVSNVTGTAVNSSSTDGTGIAGPYTVTWLTQRWNGTALRNTTQTYHTINVSASGYLVNSTSSNISSSVRVNLTLMPLAVADTCTPDSRQNLDINGTVSCTNWVSAQNVTVRGNLTITGGNYTFKSLTVLAGGNVTIRNTKTSVWQNSNLTINGTYTLDNATLHMNSTAAEEYWISVGATGTLLVVNNSVITIGSTSGTGFIIDSANNITVRNSIINQSRIITTNRTFSLVNATINSTNVGVQGSANVSIVNSTINSVNSSVTIEGYGAQTLLQGSTLTNTHYASAVNLYTGLSNVELRNNTIVTIWIGIAISSTSKSNLTITDQVIYAGTGVYNNDGAAITFENSKVYSDANGYDAHSGASDIIRNVSFNVSYGNAIQHNPNLCSSGSSPIVTNVSIVTSDRALLYDCPSTAAVFANSTIVASGTQKIVNLFANATNLVIENITIQGTGANQTLIDVQDSSVVRLASITLRPRSGSRGVVLNSSTTVSAVDVRSDGNLSWAAIVLDDANHTSWKNVVINGTSITNGVYLQQSIRYNNFTNISITNFTNAGILSGANFDSQLRIVNATVYSPSGNYGYSGTELYNAHFENMSVYTANQRIGTWTLINVTMKNVNLSIGSGYSLNDPRLTNSRFYNVHMDNIYSNSGSNVVFENSSIGTIELYTNTADITFRNTTFRGVSGPGCDGTPDCTVTVQWFTTVKTTNRTGAVQAGATVNATLSNGTTMFSSVTTNGLGLTTPQIMTQYIWRNGVNTSYQPAVFRATMTGMANATKSISITNNSQVNMTVAEATVCVNETGRCFGTVQEAIDNATAGQTVIITDSSEYIEQIYYGTSFLRLTSNGTVRPRINGTTGYAFYGAINPSSIDIQGVDFATDSGASALYLQPTIMNITDSQITGGNIAAHVFYGPARFLRINISMAGGQSPIQCYQTNSTTVIDQLRYDTTNGIPNYPLTCVYATVRNSQLNSSYYGLDSGTYTNVSVNSERFAVYVLDGENISITNSTLIGRDSSEPVVWVNNRNDVNVSLSISNSTIRSLGGGPALGTYYYLPGSYSQNVSINWTNVDFNGSIAITGGSPARISVNLLNTSDANVTFTGFNGTAYANVSFANYLDVRVNSTTGINLSSATVNGYTNVGETVFTSVTNSTGQISRQTVVYKWNFSNATQNTSTYLTNHTVAASLTGYTSANKSLNMSTNQNTFITLSSSAVACGDTITANATLSQNISINGSAVCLTVSGDNIALDCAGYSITSNLSASSYGVLASGRNLTLRNCAITNFYYPLALNNTNGTLIRNTSAYGNAGVQFSNASHTIIENISLRIRNGDYVVLNEASGQIFNLTVENSTLTPDIDGVLLNAGSGQHFIFRNVTIGNLVVYPYGWPSNVTFINSTLAGRAIRYFEAGTVYSNSNCTSQFENETDRAVIIRSCSGMTVRNVTFASIAMPTYILSTTNITLRNLSTSPAELVDTGTGTVYRDSNLNPWYFDLRGNNHEFRNMTTSSYIRFDGATNASVIGSTITSTELFRLAWSSISGIALVENTTLLNTTELISLSSTADRAGTFVFRNVSLNQSKLNGYNSTSSGFSITAQSFIDTYINTTSGVALAGATVTITNATGETVGSKVTGADGYANAFNVTYFWRNATTSVNYTNYTITVSATGYVTTNRSVNASTSQLQNFTLSLAASTDTCSPAAGTNLTITATANLQCNDTTLNVNSLTVLGNITLLRSNLTANVTGIASGGRFTARNTKNSIWQNGNLTINGTYVLDNATLRMNGTVDQSIGITVNVSALFTAANGSAVDQGDNSSFTYFWNVSGTLNATNSSISNGSITQFGTLDFRNTTMISSTELIRTKSGSTATNIWASQLNTTAWGTTLLYLESGAGLTSVDSSVISANMISIIGYGALGLRNSTVIGPYYGAMDNQPVFWNNNTIIGPWTAQNHGALIYENTTFISGTSGAAEGLDIRDWTTSVRLYNLTFLKYGSHTALSIPYSTGPVTIDRIGITDITTGNKVMISSDSRNNVSITNSYFTANGSTIMAVTSNSTSFTNITLNQTGANVSLLNVTGARNITLTNWTVNITGNASQGFRFTNVTGLNLSAISIWTNGTPLQFFVLNQTSNVAVSGINLNQTSAGGSGDGFVITGLVEPVINNATFTDINASIGGNLFWTYTSASSWNLVNVNRVIFSGSRLLYEPNLYNVSFANMSISATYGSSFSFGNNITFVDVNDTALYGGMMSWWDISNVNLTRYRALNGLSGGNIQVGRGSVTNYTITDSYIVGAFEFLNDNNASVNQSVVFTNVTFGAGVTNISMTPCDGTPNCTATIRHYVTVNVTNSSGSPITGASVNATNNTGSVVASGSTAGTGLSSRFTITEKVIRNNVTLTSQNTTFAANYSSLSNSTRKNITSSQTVLVVLQAQLTVCVNETGNCFTTIQGAVDNATSGQTVIITDGGTYSESVYVMRNVTITSNGSAYPYVRSTTQPVFHVLNPYTLTLRKLNATFSSADSTWVNAINGTNLVIEDVSLELNTTSDGIGFNGPYYSSHILNRVNFSVTNSGYQYILFGTYLGTYSVNNSRFTGLFNGSGGIYAGGGSGGPIENSYFEARSGARTTTTPGPGTLYNLTFNGTTLRASAGDITLVDSTFTFNSSLDNYAISFMVGQTTLRRVNITGTNYGLMTYADSNTILIEDVQINSLNYQFYLLSAGGGINASVRFINSSIVPTNVSLEYKNMSNLNITFERYLDVQVNSNTTGLSSASVTVTNSTGGSVASSNTNSSGGMARRNITWYTYTQRNTSISNWTETNHTVTASKTGYVTNSTSFNLSISRSTTLNLSLSYSVCVNETGNCFTTIQGAVDNATAGQTVIITDSGTYPESITVSRNITITSNGTGLPLISPVNATAIQTASAAVTLRRLNFSVLGSGTLYVISGHFNITDSIVWWNISPGGYNGALYLYPLTGPGHIFSINRVNFTGYQTGPIRTQDVYNISLNNSIMLGEYVSPIAEIRWAENTIVNITGGNALHYYRPYAWRPVVRNVTSYVDGVGSILSHVDVYDSRLNTTGNDGLRGGDNSTIVNSVIIGGISGNNGISTYDGGDNLTLINVTVIATGTQLSIAGNTYDRVNVINSTPTPATTGFGVASEVYYSRYLDVYVNTTAGIAVPSASIVVRNVSSEVVANTTTASNGSISQQTIRYAFKNSTTTAYLENHTVNATKTGYLSNQTTVNMTLSRLVSLTLQQLLPVCVNETGNCFATIQEAITNATTGQAVVITDNATYTESLTISKNLTLTSNGTGLPTIKSTNTTVVTTSGYEVNISKVNITLIGSTDGASGIYGYNFRLSDSVMWLNTTGASTIGLSADGTVGRVTINRVNLTSTNVTYGAHWYLATTATINNSILTGAAVYLIGDNYGTVTDKTIENTYINATTSAILSNGRGITIVNTTVYTVGAGLVSKPNDTIQNSYFNSSGNSAIYFEGGVTIRNSTVVSGSGLVPIRTYGAAVSNATSYIIDTTTDSSGYHLQVDGAAADLGMQIIVINSTITPSNTNTNNLGANDDSNVTYQRYLDVYVNSTSGTAISGATVLVYDNVSTLKHNISTSGNGSIVQQNVTYATRHINSSTDITTNVTNHSIFASRTGYVTNSTAVNMTLSRNTFVMLSTYLPVCVNETGNCFATIQEAVDNATSGQTVVITDNATYLENITITKALTLTSNSSTLPRIRSINRTTILTNSDLNLSRVNVSVNGSPGYNAISHGFSRALQITDAVFEFDTDSAGIDLNGGSLVMNRTNITLIFANYGVRPNGGTLLTIENVRMTGTAGLGFVFTGDTMGTGSRFQNIYVNGTAGNALISLVNGINATARNLTLDGGALSLGYGSNILDVITYGQILSRENATVINATVYSDSSIDTGNGAQNFTLINSTLSGPTQVRAAFSSGYLVLRNTSAEMADIVFSSSTNTVRLERFLDVYVNASNGTPVNGATVTVTNSTGGIVLSATTDATGRISQAAIAYAIVNATISSRFENHTVSAIKAGFGSANTTANMSVSRSMTLTIANTAPTLPTLTRPLNNNYTVTERYPTFNWTASTDTEGDAITYQWNITPASGCAAIPLKNTSAVYYTSTDKLCIDRVYNWSVRACDTSNACSAYATQFNFTIPSVVGITFTSGAVDFGSVQPSLPGINSTNDTLANSPSPLVYNNTGNVDAITTVKANAALWTAQLLNTTYFQYGDENASSWQNVTSNYTNLTANLTTSVLREIELLIWTPQGEPGGAKNTTITVLGASLE